MGDLVFLVIFILYVKTYICNLNLIHEWTNDVLNES